MKTLAFLVVLTVVVLPAQAASTRNPRVRVPETVPFTVHGTGFAPRERVEVSVMVNTRRAHVVGANAAGAFTTTFPSLKLERVPGTRSRRAGAAAAERPGA